MKLKSLPALSALGIVAAAMTPQIANAGKGTVVELSPTHVRTYCNTQLKRATDATETAGGQVALTDDNQVDTGVSPGGNEVVWQVIGTLPQDPPGEGYCGYLEIPAIGIGASGANIADRIQDCVAVAQFDIASSGWKGASLNWQGASIGGVYQSLSVSVCAANADEVAQGNWVDNFGEDADMDGQVDTPDCIVDGLDFAGGAFVSIHDVQNQKSDNNVGLIAGADDLTFLNPFPARNMGFSAAGVDAVNGAAGGTIDLIIRCADSNGANNGFLGGTTNALIIHDPPGVGFGAPGEIKLQLSK